MFTPKPHVSKALSHLRYRVAAAAAALAFCASLQLLVFGFTHFTTVRWQFATPQNLVRELAVVPPVDSAPARTLTPDASAEHGRKARKLSEFEAEQSVRTPSRWDAVLSQFSALAGVGGVIAAATLTILTLLGVVIAGGGSVPGVERAVSAATWALVLSLVCIPWRDVMPSVPFAGVFGRYSDLTAASAAVTAGKGDPWSLYAGYLFLPTTALAVALLIWAQFREGVDRGIIVTTASELDLTVEREMAKVRRRGVTSHVGPRSTGALNMAIGQRPPPEAAPVLTMTSAADPRPRATDRRIGDPDRGDPLKRPI